MAKGLGDIGGADRRRILLYVILIFGCCLYRSTWTVIVSQYIVCIGVL